MPCIFSFFRFAHLRVLWCEKQQRKQTTGFFACYVTFGEIEWMSFRNHRVCSSRQICSHYSDVIMSAMASQITGASIVGSTVCWGADQRKHQSPESPAFFREIHWVFYATIQVTSIQLKTLIHIGKFSVSPINKLIFWNHIWQSWLYECCCR